MLKESEKGLAEAQRIAHVGSWDWNIVTDEVQWSDETYRICELGPQEFGATYNAFLSLVHPEDRDYVDDAVEKALNGEPFSIDYRIILSNRNEREVHIESKVIFDENNIPTRMKETVQGITERKRLEMELESIARLPQENPNPVIRLSKGLIINYANPASHILLTYWGSAINQKAPPAITDMAIAAFADGTQRKFEYNYANNTYIINITPFPQSGYVNLYASDITDHKRAEAALQDSENKYRTLFESIDEGFCIIEMIFGANGKPIDYRFLETNPAFEKQTGCVKLLEKRCGSSCQIMKNTGLKRMEPLL